MKQILSLTIFFVVALSGNVHAEESASTPFFILDSFVDLSFEPSKIELIISDTDGNLHKHQAVAFPLSEMTKEEGQKRYLVGGRIPGNLENYTSYCSLISGKNGESAFITPRDISSEDYSGNSSSELHAEVLAKRQELKKLRDDMDSATMKLKQLRLETANISDIAKIIEVEEDTKRIKESSSELSHDIITLKSAIESVKALPEPIQFERRKVLLTEQLSDLARAALEAEQGAFSRRKNTEADLDKKLALIDATRFDEVEDLEREFARLAGKPLESAGITNNTQPVPEALPNENSNLEKVEPSDYFRLDQG